MTDVALRAERLSIGYGEKVVIGGIEFAIAPGEILALIGPNGAGKSTLLKTIIGSLPPVSGVISLDGKDLAGLKESEIAKKMAAVLTNRPRPELMTCEDIVSTGRYPYTGLIGILSAEDRRIVENASDGQRQRVMLARAIAQEPRVLVMDEPTSFLDIKHKLDFLTLLGGLVREQKIAVILSLHEIELAQRFADTLMCMRDGRIDRVGTPDEIFSGNYIDELYGMERGTYQALFSGTKERA